MEGSPSASVLKTANDLALIGVDHNVLLVQVSGKCIQGENAATGWEVPQLSLLVWVQYGPHQEVYGLIPHLCKCTEGCTQRANLRRSLVEILPQEITHLSARFVLRDGPEEYSKESNRTLVGVDHTVAGID